MKPKENRYISEIKQGKQTRYQVRLFSCSDHKPEISKSFSTTEHGSPEQSLLAARAWRDQMISADADYFDRKTKQTRIAKRGRSDNKTGVVGVYHNRQTRIRGTKTYKAFNFIAQWREVIDGKNKTRTKSFGYNPDIEGDEQRALTLAVEHRQLKEKELYRKETKFNKKDHKTQRQIDALLTPKQPKPIKGINKTMGKSERINSFREELIERLEGPKARAKAALSPLTFKSLSTLMEVATELRREKEAEHLAEEKRIAKAQQWVNDMVKSAPPGVAVDVEALCAAVNIEKPKREYNTNREKMLYKHAIIDKNKRVRLWTGCGRPPVQVLQVLTAKQVKDKYWTSIELDKVYQYKHAFKDLTRCITIDEFLAGVKEHYPEFKDVISKIEAIAG